MNSEILVMLGSVTAALAFIAAILNVVSALVRRFWGDPPTPPPPAVVVAQVMIQASKNRFRTNGKEPHPSAGD